MKLWSNLKVWKLSKEHPELSQVPGCEELAGVP